MMLETAEMKRAFEEFRAAHGAGFTDAVGYHVFTPCELVRLTMFLVRAGVNVLDLGRAYRSTTGNYVLPFEEKR